MNIQELATAVLNQVPVKVMILNNQYLGMVRQWQELFYGRRYAFTCLQQRASCPPDCDSDFSHCPETGVPDFVRLAESYGAAGFRVTKKEEVAPVIEKALALEGPVLVDFVIEKEENVFPMVPGGASLKHMIGGIA